MNSTLLERQLYDALRGLLARRNVGTIEEAQEALLAYETNLNTPSKSAPKFVSTYLRTYRKWDGTLVEDEVNTFNEIHGRSYMVSGSFVEGKGYPVAQAEHIIAMWTAMSAGVPDRTYRLGPIA